MMARLSPRLAGRVARIAGGLLLCRQRPLPRRLFGRTHRLCGFAGGFLGGASGVPPPPSPPSVRRCGPSAPPRRSQPRLAFDHRRIVRPGLRAEPLQRGLPRRGGGGQPVVEAVFRSAAIGNFLASVGTRYPVSSDAATPPASRSRRRASGPGRPARAPPMSEWRGNAGAAARCTASSIDRVDPRHRLRDRNHAPEYLKLARELLAAAAGAFERHQQSGLRLCAGARQLGRGDFSLHLAQPPPRSRESAPPPRSRRSRRRSRAGPNR